MLKTSAVINSKFVNTYVCFSVPVPLGMESVAITDSQINASSVCSYNHCFPSLALTRG